MKWKKFLELQKRHPFIEQDLKWRGDLLDTKEFVRKKVSFIAFRPFDSLDLCSKSTLMTPVNWNSHSNVVHYHLSFHIEGEEYGTNFRHVNGSVGDGSIQAQIDDATKWLENEKEFDGRQLVWERVVRTTMRVGTITGLTEMSLEIYLFPRQYRYRQTPREPFVPPDPATIAYMEGRPMPPIIPGTLTFMS